MKQHGNKASASPRKRLAALALVLAMCLSFCGCAQETVDVDAFLRAANEFVEAIQSENGAVQPEQPGQPAETEAPAQDEAEEPAAVDLSTYVRPLDEAHVQTGVMELDGEAVESMYVDNELVLFAEDGVPREDIEKLAAAYGAEISGYIENADLFQLSFPDAMSADELTALAEAFHESPEIQDCFCNAVIEAQDENAVYPNDLSTAYNEMLKRENKTEEDVAYAGYYRSRVWGHTVCKLPEAWEIVRLVNPEPHVRLGLMDDSMDASHNDLHFTNAFWWDGEEHDRYNPYTVAQNFPEGAKHGTHVAGIMGAKNDNRIGISGVALNASLVGVSMRKNDKLDKKYLVKYTEWAGAVACLLDSNVKVINISLGCGVLSAPMTKWVAAKIKKVLDKYMDYHDERSDFLIVTAAGNDGNKQHDTNYANAFANISEAYLRDRIIVVGNAAKIATDRYSRASSSSYKGGRVDVMAPGSDIYSTVPYSTENDPDTGDGCDYMSGTSMASPFVAGLAGLIWEANPNLSPEDVKRIIVETADIAVEDSDANMVNAEAAVLKALGYDPRPEAEAPEDEFLGEDELAARFRAELLGTEDFFICGDFDGDDTLEAFGGSSEPDGSNWWKKLHVYYVDNRGSVTEVENACPEKGVFLTDSADGTTTMLDFGTKRLLDIGYYPATAIGSCGVMVGVRDGKAYVPQGMRDILVEEIEGLYVYVGSFVWSDGEPQMEEHSYLFDEATGEFILLQEEEQEITIRFDYRTDQSKGSWTEEYAIISGIDADGNTLWTRETEHLGLTESTHIRSIGISGELYYYADDGITAIRVKDGAFVWKNIDVYTPCAFAIGEDGTIYLCCHYDLDFAAIDKYGNTLAHITALAPDSLWPDKIEIEGDKVKITETYNDNKVFYVDRNTFEVTR